MTESSLVPSDIKGMIDALILAHTEVYAVLAAEDASKGWDVTAKHLRSEARSVLESAISKLAQDSARLTELEELRKAGRLKDLDGELVIFSFVDDENEAVDWGEYTLRATANKALSLKSEAADSILASRTGEQG